MEVALLLFTFIFVLIGQVLLGFHITPTNRDFKKYRKGLAYLAQKRYQDMVLYFEQALKENKESAVAWSYKGIAYFFLDNYYQTLADCNKALDIDYTLAECYFYKGRAFFALEEFAQAHKEFEKNLWHSRQKLPEAYRYKGLCNLKLKKYEAAKEDFKQAVLMHDEDANYYLLQIQKKNYEEG